MEKQAPAWIWDSKRMKSVEQKNSHTEQTLQTALLKPEDRWHLHQRFSYHVAEGAGNFGTSIGPDFASAAARDQFLKRLVAAYYADCEAAREERPVSPGYEKRQIDWDRVHF